MPYTSEGTGHLGTDTSEAAALKLDRTGRKQSLKSKVYNLIEMLGPISATEIVAIMPDWEYSLRPRISELRKAGLVRASAEEGVSGRKSREKKWEATDMTEPTCQFCGLMDKAVCLNADRAEDCPHAPVEGKGPLIRYGPMRGLRRLHYGVIEADPPWSYKTYSNREQGTVPHRTEAAPYESMTLEQLKALPVGEVAAKDCLLHMWVISSHFDQALDLGRAWGFTFKSLGMVWVKTQKSDPEKPKMGMGKWLRQEAEIALIFTKGKPSRVSAGVRQTILEPAREHSRKPDDRLTRLEALVDGPYLEMFSRSTGEGWDTMGNETGKFDRDPPPILDAEAMSLL